MIAFALAFGLAAQTAPTPGTSPGAPAGAPAVASAVAPAVAPAFAPSNIVRVAVYDLAFDKTVVEPRAARLVTNLFVVELRKLQGISVVSMDEVRAMLDYEADKQLLGCTEAKACHSSVGEALGVDQIIVGELGVVGDVSTLSLRRIDQAAAKVVDSFAVRLTPDGGEEFLAAIGPAVEKLFPELALKPGVSRGVTPELALQLNPPPLPPWATVSTGVAAGLLALGGVVAGSTALSEKATFDGLAARASKQEVEAALLDESAARTQGWAGAANGLYVGAIGASIATGVMFFFTDWTGAGQASLD